MKGEYRMKKKIKIKLPPMDILKESAEERKKRVQNSKPMSTRVEEKKESVQTP